MQEELPLLTITGVSGFIGSQVLDKALLTLGDRFRIRGCVRDKNSKLEMTPIRKYFKERLSSVQIISCDLSSKESMDKVVEGSTYVIHLAAPVPGPHVRYEEEVINPAVSGVLYILEAAQKYKVKRVVMTSSISACSEFKLGFVPQTIDETYWSEMSSPNMSAYSKSKLLAEEAAWNFVNTIPMKGPYHKVELVTLLPGFVVGKCIATGKNTSTSTIKQFMNGEVDYIPRKQVSIVDVEDVAVAHLRACTVEKAAGHRIILSAETMWLTDIAKTLHDEFQGMNYKITHTEAPLFFIKLASYFSRDVNQVLQ